MKKKKEKKKKKIGPGDRVTCVLPVEVYYSSYAGNPKTVFRPGMVGVVYAVAPKVRIVDGPEHDDLDVFLVVDYDAPETGRRERVGLNFCNARRV